MEDRLGAEVCNLQAAVVDANVHVEIWHIVGYVEDPAHRVCLEFLKVASVATGPQEDLGDTFQGNKGNCICPNVATLHGTSPRQRGGQWGHRKNVLGLATELLKPCQREEFPRS